MCDINECLIYVRNRREMEKETIISQNYSMDLLDCIHCFFVHSIGNNTASLKQYLESKQYNLRDIIGQNIFENNKFVTQIMPQIQSSDENNEFEMRHKCVFEGWIRCQIRLSQR